MSKYTSATGQTIDRQRKSYVESPDRGKNETAQEVVISGSVSEVTDAEMSVLLQEILKEMKLMNLYMSEIVGEKLEC
jgi:hypothetical protein